MKVRTLLGAVVVLLVIGAVAFGFMTLRNPGEPPATRAAQPQGVVLLIPGFGGGTQQLQELQQAMRADGVRAEILQIGDGQGDLRAYAEQVKERARELIAAGQPAPDLVGYSAGGITARLAATDDPDLFRKVVTLASPHNGTSTADAGAVFGQCPTACQQMRTDSELLAALPSPRYPSDWLSVWSDTDSVVRPPESSELPEVAGYRLQDVCAARTVEHESVPADPQAIAAVLAFLQGSGLPQTCLED